MLLRADMSPITHLCASWIIGVKTTDNTRDCRLVALAGVAPDLDGLGLVVDLTARAFGHETFLWERFHHFLLHGLFGAALIAYEQHCHELQTRARPFLLDD